MAIRLRMIENHWIALCAARSMEQPGDIYLDDSQHEALANKFHRDYGDCVPGVYEDAVEAEREESNNPNRDWWDKTYGEESV